MGTVLTIFAWNCYAVLGRFSDYSRCPSDFGTWKAKVFRKL